MRSDEENTCLVALGGLAGGGREGGERRAIQEA